MRLGVVLLVVQDAGGHPRRILSGCFSTWAAVFTMLGSGFWYSGIGQHTLGG